MSAYHIVAAPIETDRFVVLYDAGETNALKPLLEDWEKQKIDFKVLVMATAESLVLPEKFQGRRITLENLCIKENVDSQTERTHALSLDSLKLLHQVKTNVVLVGSASKIQEQILQEFAEEAKTFAFVDNFNYDVSHESFATVKKVQSAAHFVFCPSQHVVDLLKTNSDQKEAMPIYEVVGKPSLEQWEKEIATTNKDQVLKVLGLDMSKGPIITFIGGYGYGYDRINPLFEQCAKQLKEEGYQVVIQPHPKVATPLVKTTEALAISNYIVGYNSSVMFDAAVIGKNALFMIPDEVPFNHFAIDSGLMFKVKDMAELLAYIHEEKAPKDIRETLKIPKNSLELMSKLIETHRTVALMAI